MSEAREARQDLSRLMALAQRVATEYEDREAVAAAERAAKTALLTQVIEAVRPALRAIAMPIASSIAFMERGPDNHEMVEKIEHHATRGVLLQDTSYSVRTNSDAGVYGVYGGQMLYLLSDSRLAVIQRDGQWRCGGSWGKEARPLTMVSVEEVAQKWDLGIVFDNLVNALDAQRAKHDTKAARDRAERLRAIALLARWAGISSTGSTPR